VIERNLRHLIIVEKAVRLLSNRFTLMNALRELDAGLMVLLAKGVAPCPD
jgi:hypothetical protein